MMLIIHEADVFGAFDIIRHISLSSNGGILHMDLVLVLIARLQKLGALEWDKVVHQHQGWRLVTCMWLHAGLIHLLANMLSLVFIGIHLEQQFGFSKQYVRLIAHIVKSLLFLFFFCTIL